MCLIHRYNHNNDNRFITKNNSRTFTIEAAYFHINEAVEKSPDLLSLMKIQNYDVNNEPL